MSFTEELIFLETEPKKTVQAVLCVAWLILKTYKKTDSIYLYMSVGQGSLAVPIKL